MVTSLDHALCHRGIGDNGLEDCYLVGMDDVASRLGQNVRVLREGRGLTQAQMAKLAGMPRATWANLESGTANPTLAVLDRVAGAFQVTIEELIAAPQSGARHYPKGTLPEKMRGAALIRKLLPDPIPGMEIDRFELPPRVKVTGVPHTPGTREYLMCETGEIVLIASGEQYRLSPGDVVAFRGDQRHSYSNPTMKTAVAYSFVLITRRDGR
ncbi:HigA protein (antitoxin to HigB) [Labilithrix luteola]|uniref:HigA protein (Antitoxin to HigB) n=2 Tax=Labilithrix luteola TaxID=1391654 RepID=A0A0K1PYS7_9BACT|nr:HigA protein (antitoxin to HigB) [Labilithrix luteola]